MNSVISVPKQEIQTSLEKFSINKQPPVHEPSLESNVDSRQDILQVKDHFYVVFTCTLMWAHLTLWHIIRSTYASYINVDKSVYQRGQEWFQQRKQMAFLNLESRITSLWIQLTATMLQKQERKLRIWAWVKICTWSYTFLRAGAILLVNVPATIMTSDCLGLGLKMMPNLSKSYLAAPTCIISTAQHARPNVMGHMDPVLAQFTRLSTLETTNLHTQATQYSFKRQEIWDG